MPFCGNSDTLKTPILQRSCTIDPSSLIEGMRQPSAFLSGVITDS